MHWSEIDIYALVDCVNQYFQITVIRYIKRLVGVNSHLWPEWRSDPLPFEIIPVNRRKERLLHDLVSVASTAQSP